MVNFDGVWETRIFYSSSATGFASMPHVLKFDVNVVTDPTPGTAPSAIDVRSPNLVDTDLETFLTTDFLPLILACYPAGAEFTRAELWKIPEGTLNGQFITALELAEVGTNVAAANIAWQTTFTFRSQGGGSGRIQLMESSFAGNSKTTPPYASSQANALTNYIIGATSPILARDNTPFIARIHQSDGQNETLFRKRYRSL